MSAIYRQASLVIVWLGYSQEMSAAAYRFVESGYTSADDLVVLLNNRYFTRLWIVQEVLLAREVQMLCGALPISLAYVQACIQLQQDRIQPHVFNASLLLIWDSIHNRQRRELGSLLYRYVNQRCHDIKDRLFALIGLVPELENLHLDYNMSVARIYIATVQFLFRRRYRDQLAHHDNTRSTHFEAARNLAFALLPWKIAARVYVLLCQHDGLPTWMWYEKVHQIITGYDSESDTDANFSDGETVWGLTLEPRATDGGIRRLCTVSPRVRLV
jgi:hypothetical protein